MSQTPRFDSLVDRIVGLLPKTRRGNPDVTELESFLRRNHGQVWQWIVERSVLPTAEITLALVEFAQAKEAAAVKDQSEEAAK